MYGNRRQSKKKPLYVSYRCGCWKSTSSNVCINKEIRNEYIKYYVLTELESRIFNDKEIQMLVEGINENLKKQSQGDEDKRGVIKKELKDIEKQIDNIVMGITNGFIQECKNFIQDFVKEVIVYKTYGEAVFNVDFNLFNKCDV